MDPTEGAGRAPGAEDPTEVARDADHGGGVRIGPYLLLQKLGEGGMGEVWEAEQSEPVRRRVAIKVIKRGMDSAEVIARFEAERQALALMSHPAVARVFAAGETPGGRPYFVMELVRGVPITDYCDRHRLSTRDRLELFRRVCEGVQHAHQKALIHRDLKPSNILVEEQDGRPMPKIIDFGVAKATSQKLTEKTMFTQLGVLIGTPEYMSPEQAEFSGEDIDTRSDVYGLGVVLYELLTGALPFDAERLRSAGFDGIRRIIREETPTRPSTRLTTLGDEGTEAAAQRRRTDPGALRRELSGDLDWIVMRALEKERERRFASPREMARDIERHLTDRPVEAGPPATGYRLRKFVRRHRVGVAAGAVVAVALLLGLAGTTVGLVSARRAEARAVAEARTAEEVTSFLTDLFEVSDPYRAAGAEGGTGDLSARDLLDRGAREVAGSMEDEPAVRSRLMVTIGHLYNKLGLYEPAGELFQQSLEVRRASGAGPREVAESLRWTGLALAEMGDDEAAEEHLAEALDLLRRELEPASAEVAAVLATLGWVLVERNDFAGAEEAYREALEIYRSDPATERRNLVVTLGNLAAAQGGGGDYRQAIATLSELLEQQEEEFGPEHPNVAMTVHNLAVHHHFLGELDEAEPLYRRALEVWEEALGPVHPVVAMGLSNLGELLWERGHLDAAVPLYERALAIRRQNFDPEHQDIARSLFLLASLRRDQGRPDGVEALYREALEIQARALGEGSPQVGETLEHLGSFYALEERWPEAESTLRRSVEVRRESLGDDHPLTARSLEKLAGMLVERGDPEAALPLLREAREILATRLGAEHEQTVAVTDRLAAALRAAGREAEAERRETGS